MYAFCQTKDFILYLVWSKVRNIILDARDYVMDVNKMDILLDIVSVSIFG